MRNKRIFFIGLLLVAIFAGAAIQRVLTGSLLILKKDGTSSYVALEPPAGLLASTTWTLPSSDGTVGQVLKTDGTGELGWVSAGTDPMTTRGDMMYRNSSNATDRLAIGSAGDFLMSDGTDVAWGALTTSAIPDDTITNADINSAAAISGSKLQAAGTGNAGAVTTGTQSFAGDKTFTGNVTVGGSAILDNFIVDGGSFFDHYSEATYALDSQFTSGSIKVVRNGNIVTITSTGNVGHAAASTVATSNFLLASEYRPNANVTSVWNINSGSGRAHMVTVTSTGNIITSYYSIPAAAADGTVTSAPPLTISYAVP